MWEFVNILEEVVERIRVESIKTDIQTEQLEDKLKKIKKQIDKKKSTK